MSFIAITGTSLFRQERQVTVNQGEQFEIGGYQLRYNGLEEKETAPAAYLVANTGALSNGKQIDTLKPEKRFYKKPEQPTTEVAIRSTLGSDLYLVLGSYDDDTKMATILAYLNPRVVFLYGGGIVLALGTLVVIWPAPAPAREPAYAPSPASEESAPS